jgi:hypothetical protein
MYIHLYIYTHIQDSVVDFIQYSNDPALNPAKELFERINERKLYVCVGKIYINICTYMFVFH